MDLTKAEIISAVIEAECPMLNGLDIEKMNKEQIVKKLRSACCPVLEELGEA